MIPRKSSRPRRRFRDLGEVARQANHVVAAAVFVFMASILLQFVLARPMLRAAGFVHGHWGTAGVALFGPLLTDGCTSLVLLGIAFPFGRVTAVRPWPAGVALVLLVHGFWLSFHYVVGEHRLLWGHLMPVLGRSVLIVLTLLGVVVLLRWGRRVALVADGLGQRRSAEADGPGAEAAPASAPGGDGAPEGGGAGDCGEAVAEEAVAGAADLGGGIDPGGGIEAGNPVEISSEPARERSDPCKDPPPGDVPGGER